MRDGILKIKKILEKGRIQNEIIVKGLKTDKNDKRGLNGGMKKEKLSNREQQCELKLKIYSKYVKQNCNRDLQENHEF